MINGALMAAAANLRDRRARAMGPLGDVDVVRRYYGSGAKMFVKWLNGASPRAIPAVTVDADTVEVISPAGASEDERQRFWLQVQNIARRTGVSEQMQGPHPPKIIHSTARREGSKPEKGQYYQSFNVRVTLPKRYVEHEGFRFKGPTHGITAKLREAAQSLGWHTFGRIDGTPDSTTQYKRFYDDGAKNAYQTVLTLKLGQHTAEDVQRAFESVFGPDVRVFVRRREEAHV